MIEPVDRLNEILALTMPHPTRSRLITIEFYLKLLLATLWAEADGFSGKRPFGDSSWKWDIFKPLVEHRYIPGDIDDDGYIEDCDEETGDELIAELINRLCFSVHE